MKKYILTNRKNPEQPLGKFQSKVDAAEQMNEIIEENNDCLETDDEDYLTPFDFSLEEIECKEINEEIKTYEDARLYLKGKPNADFTVSKKILSGNSVQLDDVSRLVNDLNPSHVKALIALNELFTIAQAWNKADDFVPDFSDNTQCKWFPWFWYSEDVAGFVSAYTAIAPSNASAVIGSRLCFKTSARARQFGEQFIDLWNDFLMFR